LETRNSHGLEQFCTALEERSGLSILDLSGANQQTINFITNYGHRLYSDDFLMLLDEAFAREGDFYENQSNPRKVEDFMESILQFPDGTFDGVLAWNSLEFLSPSVLSLVVAKLHRIVRPGASMFAIFHAEEKLVPVADYSFRIQDSRTLLMIPRGTRKPSQVFNNRTLEKTFQEFESVKFFLTRGHLRELIIKR
jgi:hypothetical protein